MRTRLLFAKSINRIAFATIFLFVPLWVSAQDYFYYSNQQTQVAQAQEAPFITVWKTDNRATWRDEHLSGDDQIRIPGIGDEYTIEWEKVERVNDSWQATDDSLRGVGTGSDTITITFPEPGHYRVKISGDFRQIRFKGNPLDIGFGHEYGDAEKLIEIEQWGDIVWSTMESAFYRAKNLQITSIDAPDLSKVSSMNEMFYYAASVNADLNHWDVGNVTNMNSMFSYASSFNGNLSGWDVSNVTDMRAMFNFATSFNGDLNGWDVSKVEDMLSMFRYATSFNGNVSSWDVGNVLNMHGMFASASLFNGDLSSWDVGNVKYMSFMFARTESFNGDLSRWDVSNVISMQAMFGYYSAFNGDLSNWDVSNVTNMYTMLSGSALSVANYDTLLMGWSERELQHGVTLGADNLSYCNAGEQRGHIIREFGWSITDGGLAEGCDPVSVDNPDESPVEYTLYQNYPNPFNPVTQIPFELPGQSRVRLAVYDLLGRQVAVLTNRSYEAGRHEVRWDGSSSASGIYIIRMLVVTDQGLQKHFNQQVTLIK